MNKIGVLAFVGVLVLGFGGDASASGQGSAQSLAADQVRFAAVFPGSIQDDDYNAVGHAALQAAGQTHGVRTTYSENVSVADAAKVLTEYCQAGFNLIWVHGSQFNLATDEVAVEYPEVSFVVEVDSEPDERLANLWYVDRNSYTGFYVLGAVAALATQTGHIGYIGGLELPFTRAEINAARQAIRDVGSDADLSYLYVGDFNYPEKTRQAAEILISNGADVLLSSVNLGNVGIYSAVTESEAPVYITTKYTDKTDQAPGSFLTADLFDFGIPVNEILGQFLQGERGGFVYMDYGPGRARNTLLPVLNVDDTLDSRIRELASRVARKEVDIARVQGEILD